MRKLTANLAHETKYPKEKVFSVPSTPTESSHEFVNENIGPSFVTPGKRIIYWETYTLPRQQSHVPSHY